MSEDILNHVEARIAIATTDRWERIENALMEQPNPIALFEVKEIYERRKANRWSLNRLDEVIEAMECLAAPPLPDPISESCVSTQLQADVKSYSEETWRESTDHVERWLRVLQTFSGTANDSTVMTLSEAQTYADNGWPRWVPVVEALQCLEAESLNEQVEVQDETDPLPLNDEPEDTPLPLQAEETPMPQQADPDPQPDDTQQPLQAEETPMPQQAPDVTPAIRVYWHGSTVAASNVDWRISEDDHWKSEVIVQWDTPTSITHSNIMFCIGGGVWTGPDYWHQGQFRLSGITQFGHGNACTGTESGSVTVTDIDGGKRAEYRGYILVRDNNVVEKDLDVGKLVMGFGTTLSGGVDAGNTTSLAATHHIPERVVVGKNPNAAPFDGEWHWRLSGTASIPGGALKCTAFTGFIANPDAEICQGSEAYCSANSQAWVSVFGPTAWENVSQCRFTHTETLLEPIIPAEIINHADNRLPVIEDDEVAYLDIRKRSGKWLYSASKFIIQEEGADRTSSDANVRCTRWAQSKDFVYIEIREPGATGYIELPAGDVSDYDIRDARIVTGCGRSTNKFELVNINGTVRENCASNRPAFKGNVRVDSVWIGGWGEVKASTHDQIRFEQASLIVNLCN